MMNFTDVCIFCSRSRRLALRYLVHMCTRFSLFFSEHYPLLLLVRILLYLYASSPKEKNHPQIKFIIFNKLQSLLNNFIKVFHIFYMRNARGSPNVFSWGSPSPL